MKNKNWSLYICLIIGISFGVLGIFIFKGLNNKDWNSWLGIIGAMLSLIGIILSIISSINLETYYSSIKYLKLDKKIKNIQEKIPEITRKALEIKSLINGSRGKDETYLNGVSNQINDFCTTLTNLFTEDAEYTKDYDIFLCNGKKEKITKILTDWNSGVDSKCNETLQYVHENLANTVNIIKEKNLNRIDKSLMGIVYN